MRVLLVLLGIAALLLLAALMLGFVSIDQTRSGVVRAPEFKADVGTVDMGMENRTVAVPTISVDRPADPPTGQPERR